MNRKRHLLPVFFAVSLAAHAAALWYWPDVTALPPAQQRGDAGMQLTLARPAQPAAPAGSGGPEADGMTWPAPEPATTANRRMPGPAPVGAAPATVANPTRLPENQAPEPTPAAGDTAAGPTLQVQLLDALQPHFHYPPLARRRGWEGTVRIGLHVHADGRISDVRIIETSRHKVLDRAALDCLARVGQLPGAVAWLDGRESDIVLPIEYRLTDG